MFFRLRLKYRWYNLLWERCTTNARRYSMYPVAHTRCIYAIHVDHSRPGSIPCTTVGCNGYFLNGDVYTKHAPSNLYGVSTPSIRKRWGDIQPGTFPVHPVNENHIIKQNKLFKRLLKSKQ